MRHKKAGIAVFIFAVITAAALALAPVQVSHARAGGGQNYSSGSSRKSSSSSSRKSSSHRSHSSSSSRPSSSSSSGSSGSSGGSGEPSGAGKALGFIIFIAIVYLVIRSKKRKIDAAAAARGSSAAAANIMSAMTGAISNVAGGPAPVINLNDQIAEFKKQDPNFSEQQFDDIASTAFFKVQDAWSKRNMSSARSFVSPTLLNRFQAQLDQMKQEGKVNKMEKLAVGSVDLAEVAHDGGNDYITVKINASAADYTIEEKSGKIVSGSKDPEPFTEYWTFLRSDQVKTPSGTPELISKHCPNCGAPLQVNAIGKCDYCGSEVTSGHYSWVLSEITQASAWKPRAFSKRPQNISPLGAERYVLGIVKCPSCGSNVQDIAGVTNEKCWNCGNVVPTKQ